MVSERDCVISGVNDVINGIFSLIVNNKGSTLAEVSGVKKENVGSLSLVIVLKARNSGNTD